MAPADTAQAREASNPSRCGLFTYLQKTFDFQSLRRGIFLRMPDFLWSLPPIAERMHSAACLISIPGFYSTFAERLIRLRF